MYLKKDNLIIRNANENDINILCEWWSDGKIMAHAGFPNGVNTDSNKLLEKIKNQNDSSKRLILEIDNNKIGEMSYSINNEIAEIGIKICDFSYQEKGYGTLALKLLIEYLFTDLKVKKVILDTNLKNTRAQHVYEKLGFKKVQVKMNSWADQLGILQSSIDYELTKDCVN